MYIQGVATCNQNARAFTFRLKKARFFILDVMCTKTVRPIMIEFVMMLVSPPHRHSLPIKAK